MDLHDLNITKNDYKTKPNELKLIILSFFFFFYLKKALKQAKIPSGSKKCLNMPHHNHTCMQQLILKHVIKKGPKNQKMANATAKLGHMDS